MAKDDGFASGMIVGAMLAKATAPRPAGEFSANMERARLQRLNRTSPLPDFEANRRIKFAYELLRDDRGHVDWLGKVEPDQAQSLGKKIRISAALMVGTYKSGVKGIEAPSVVCPGEWSYKPAWIQAVNGDRIAVGSIVTDEDGQTPQAKTVGYWNLSDPAQRLVDAPASWLHKLWAPVSVSQPYLGWYAMLGATALTALAFGLFKLAPGYWHLLFYPVAPFAFFYGMYKGVVLCGSIHGVPVKEKMQKDEREKATARLVELFESRISKELGTS